MLPENWQSDLLEGGKHQLPYCCCFSFGTMVFLFGHLHLLQDDYERCDCPKADFGCKTVGITCVLPDAKSALPWHTGNDNDVPAKSALVRMMTGKICKTTVNCWNRHVLNLMKIYCCVSSHLLSILKDFNVHSLRKLPSWFTFLSKR